MERDVGCEFPFQFPLPLCFVTPRGQATDTLPLLLKSESEAVIKGERSADEPIEKLQEETIKHVHKE